MKTELFTITWAALHNLALIPLVFVLMGAMYYRLVRTKQAVTLLAATEYAKQFVINFSSQRQIIKSVLKSGALFFLVVALLRPQWNTKEEFVMQEGRDLFVALDVSRSMLAQDAVPNRLELAKQKIKTLLRKLSCERVGLILFSGSTFVQCPLTRDYSAFYMFLDHITVESISSGTTAIDKAIEKSIESFESAGERKNKLLVLVTDGEDFSKNLSSVRTRAQDTGMHIFTLGLGSQEGAPIPLFDKFGKQIGHQKDEHGSVVISRLNESLLHSVAQESGGTYIRVTDDTSDIQQLVKRVQSFEKESMEDKKISRLEEQYQYPLAISFIFLALEWLL